MTHTVTDLPIRIRENIRVNGITGCWEWWGKRKRVPSEPNYGQLWWMGRNYRAHRFVYELLVGPIPEGRQIDHLCRNPGCVNPGHLEAVTGQVNVNRGRAAQPQPLPPIRDEVMRRIPRRAVVAPSLVGDLLAVFGDGERVHSDVLCERLRSAYPGRYDGWEPVTLSAALRPLGIRTRTQMWATRPDGQKRNRAGVYRGDLMLAQSA